jgi:hypothetical protein
MESNARCLACSDINPAATDLSITAIKYPYEMWFITRPFLTDVTAFDIYKDTGFLSIQTANESNVSTAALL